MAESGERGRAALRRDYWLYFAREAGRNGDCPLYEHLARAIADDPDMQAITLPARPGQPPANMLFAAAHDLLLAGAAHELRLYFPHLLKDGETLNAPDARTYAIFQDFVARHRTQMDALIAARVTNTNEVRRCSFLRAGYAHVAAQTGRALHIVELGPSAGLNLNWDRYAYRYDGPDGTTLRGGPASALTIDAAWLGDTPPPVPQDPPAVAARTGLELNAVDLSSADDRRWLVALIWPGRVERIERLRAALEIAARHPPPIRQGDALALLPAALEEVAPTSAAVVSHSLVTYQWTDAMRARLEDILLEASARRPIHRLFVDTIGRSEDPGRYWLRERIYRNGTMDERALAETHPHGAWIRWLGPEG